MTANSASMRPTARVRVKRLLTRDNFLFVGVVTTLATLGYWHTESIATPFHIVLFVLSAVFLWIRWTRTARPDYAVHRAERYVMHGREDLAEKELRSGLEEDPGNEEARRMLESLRHPPQIGEAGNADEAQVLAAYGKDRKG